MAMGTQSPEAGPLRSRSEVWATAGNPGGWHVESAKLMIGSELGGGLGSVRSGRAGHVRAGAAGPGPAGLDTEVSGSEGALVSSVGRGCLSLELRAHPQGPAFPQGYPFL